MALTEETIKAVEGLSDLAPEQIQAIANLSRNDESVVVSKRIGEIYGGLDKDIFEASGVEKPDGLKTYDYAKSVISSLSEKAKAADELDGYKAKVSELEQAIKDGKGNESIVQQLKDAQSQVTQLQAQSEETAKEWEAKYNGALADLEKTKTDREFSDSLAGIEFNEGITDSISKILVDNAKSDILSTYKMDIIKVDGRDTTVWRDENGEIARNKANGLNPFTTKELVTDRLKDAIGESGGAGGPGTRPPKNANTMTIGNAKTQVEADEAISAKLMSEGIARGTKEFTTAHMKLRKDNSVSKLPMR